MLLLDIGTQPQLIPGRVQLILIEQAISVLMEAVCVRIDHIRHEEIILAELLVRIVRINKEPGHHNLRLIPLR